MAVRNTRIVGKQIAASVAGGGLKKDTSDNLELNLATAGGLEVATDQLKISALGVTGGMIAESTIGESKLNIFNSATLGQVLGFTSNGLEWVGKESTDSLTENDVITGEVPTGDINGINTGYTIANSPVAGVCVFLNGLLQQEGTGKDYTRVGTAITFAIAPETGDILVVNYFIA